MSFLESLANALQPKNRETENSRPGSLIAFAETDIVTDRGAFTLRGREPFRAILELADRVIETKESGVTISVLAAEQIGKTIAALAIALRLVVDLARNVGYFLPTDTFAHKFGRTRLKNLVRASKYLVARLKSSKDAVDQATVKECDGHFLLVLGLESMLGAISWPMDALINDEVDLLPVENREWAEGRVAASDLRFTLNISAGYAPGAGIDRCWQEGTQSRWFVRCVACRKESCLEEHFPACALKVGGKWRRVCPHCQEAIDPDKGRWIATHPERAKDGNYSFRISSLSIGARDLKHVMTRWEKARNARSKKAKFDCAERAIPNAGAMQPINEVELARMRQVYAMQLGLAGRPRWAGLDMGDVCHLLVLEPSEIAEQPRLAWLEVVDSDEVQEVVAQRIGQLGIVSMVVDKKPQTTEARGLAYSFPHIVKLQDFKNGALQAVVDEQHNRKKYQCVKVDRTDSLNETTALATDEKLPLIIPDHERLPEAQAEVVVLFEEHAKNLRKERTVDSNGRAIDTYLTAVENHFGMALNSARIAREIAAPHLKVSVARLPRTRRSKLEGAAGVGRDSGEVGRRGRRGASLRRVI